MPKTNISTNIVQQIQKVIVLKKTTWCTTPLTLYTNDDIICFKYSTPHGNLYIGVMMKDKTDINNTIFTFDTFKKYFH